MTISFIKSYFKVVNKLFSNLILDSIYIQNNQINLRSSFRGCGVLGSEVIVNYNFWTYDSRISFEKGDEYESFNSD